MAAGGGGNGQDMATALKRCSWSMCLFFAARQGGSSGPHPHAPQLPTPPTLAPPAVSREFEKEAKAPTPGVIMVPIENEPLSYTLLIEAPSELWAPGAAAAVPSPYAGKIFECTVKCPAEYPHQPPRCVMWGAALALPARAPVLFRRWAPHLASPLLPPPHPLLCRRLAVTFYGDLGLTARARCTTP